MISKHESLDNIQDAHEFASGDRLDVAAAQLAISFCAASGQLTPEPVEDRIKKVPSAQFDVDYFLSEEETRFLPAARTVVRLIYEEAHENLAVELSPGPKRSVKAEKRRSRTMVD